MCGFAGLKLPTREFPVPRVGFAFGPRPHQDRAVLTDKNAGGHFDRLPFHLLLCHFLRKSFPKSEPRRGRPCKLLRHPAGTGSPLKRKLQRRKTHVVRGCPLRVNLQHGRPLLHNIEILNLQERIEGEPDTESLRE